MWFLVAPKGTFLNKTHKAYPMGWSPLTFQPYMFPGLLSELRPVALPSVLKYAVFLSTLGPLVMLFPLSGTFHLLCLLYLIKSFC